MSDVRPAIPDPIKRVVRQRCGFGCVICGFPLVHYDHMTEWSVVREHRADNLTLLCPNHHQQKTNGLLTEEQVRAADAKPYNRERRMTAPFGLNLMGPNPPGVVIGGNMFTWSGRVFAAYRVDGEIAVGATTVDVCRWPFPSDLRDANDALVLSVVDHWPHA